MDFEGQKLAEIIFHILIIAFGAVGWVIGYFQQDFTVVFQAWLVGLVLSVIVSAQYFSPKHRFKKQKNGKEKCCRCSSFRGGSSHRLILLLLLYFAQICVPDWPFYNRHPVKWLESVPPERNAATSKDK